MQHLRFSVVAACLLLCGCSAGDAPGTPMIPSGEQPALNDQQPPANHQPPPANTQAPPPGPQSLPCNGSTEPAEFLQLLTDLLCSQVDVCRCTADMACDGCATCFDRCRCQGGENRVCRDQCGDQEQVSFDWGPTCHAYRACIAGEGCQDLTVIANPLPVCPSDLKPCLAEVVTAFGCSLSETPALDLSFDQAPACAKIADLLDQATTSASQRGADAGTDVPNGG